VFDTMKLRTKIILLVLAALVGMAVISALSAVASKRDLIDGRKAVIRAVVESAHNTALFYQAQEAAGLMTREQAQKAAVDFFLAAHYGGKDGKTEFLYVYTMDGVNIAHPKREWIGKNLSDKIKDILVSAKTTPDGAFLDLPFPRPGGTVPVPKLHFVKQFAPWGWLIGSGVYMDDVAADYQQRLLFDLSVAAALLAAIALLGLTIARGMLRQVGGEPAEAIALMSRAAAGDLTVEVRDAPKGSMLASMGEMVGAIRQMLSEISRDSGRLVSDSERIGSAAREVSAASQHQSDATSAMAAAIEEMTVSINQISDNASDTERESSTSARLAEEGVGRVQKASFEINEIATTVSLASARIRALDERANQISSIAGVIKEIAGQTNLLALNAAIEAARAGEQGRGFAVVADEVRKLAERTSAATIQIEQMIAGIQSDTEDVVGVMDGALPQVQLGVQAAESAAEALRQIKDGAQVTLARIREVANAAKEESVASNSIARRVEEIAQMVEETSAAMKSTAEIAGSLEQISGELNRLVGRFRC
jgi:methyl-accepting chemotaxis protein